ncbi:type II toxin-antitoxin system RelE/ParE family toxin [Microbacterium aurum]
MTYRLKLGEEAQADIDDVLEWSLFRFGASVRDGYHALIRATFRGIAGDPELPGSHSRDDLGQGIRTVHLRTSRNEVSAEARRIANPRHFVVYRQAGEVIQVVRLLHEASDIRAEYIPK